MARAETVGYPTMSKDDNARQRRYEVEDALQCIKRAGEVVSDNKLMAEVKAMAAEKADEMGVIAKQAGKLAKMGRISPKQLAKLGAR